MKTLLLRALIYGSILVGVVAISGDLGAAARLGLYTLVCALILLASENRLVRERELDALRQELQTYARAQADEATSRSATFTREFTTTHHQRQDRGVR
ncbi:hypothetical protein [Nocardioides pakistanensis]